MTASELGFHAFMPTVAIVNNSIVRNNFKTTTWILLGSALQSCVVMTGLPARTVCIPALLITAVLIAKTILVAAGFLPNEHAAGALPGRTMAAMPDETGGLSTSQASGDIVCLHLAMRNNSPLGIADRYFGKMGGYMTAMMEDLSKNRATNGLLSSSSFMGSERDTNSTMLFVMYFKSLEALQKFAHSGHHKAAWDWWNRDHEAMKHLSIMHETLVIPAENWETIYVNTAPTMLGSAKYAVEKDGEIELIQGITNAKRGGYTSLSKRVL